MPRLSAHLATAALTLTGVAACSEFVQPTVASDTVVMSPVHRASTLAPEDIRTVYGPARFVRTAAAPAVDTFTISGYGPEATLKIQSGLPNGSRRVSSGSVSIDGVEVVGPSDFSNKIGSITRAITLRNSSQVRVSIAGSPNDEMTLTIDSHLATAAEVPSSGGAIQLLGDQVTLTVPAGAVSGPLTVTSEPASPPSDEAVPGATIEMGPSGTTFAAPVTLAIAFDPAQLPKGARASSLRMHWWNTDHWELLPGNQVDLSRGVVSAQTTHFSLFSLLPGDVAFCPGDPTAEPDLRTAVTHVAAGGTVYVCDGTHAVPSTVIDKPMTLRGSSATAATLADADAGGDHQAGTPILRIDGIPSGLVRISDIGFSVTDQGIRPWGVFDKVEIDHVRFTGPAGLSNVAVRVDSTTVTGARVDVSNSMFTQLLLGVWPVREVETNVRNSTFDVFTGGAVVYSSGNTATTQSFGRTEDNQFSNCSTAGCVRVLTNGAVTVARNRFEARDQPVTLGAVTIQSTTLVPGAIPTVIEENVFVSQRTAAAANTPAGWQFQNAIYISDGNVRTHIVRRNTVSGTYTGLFLSADVNATDNTFNDGYYLFRQSAARSVTIQRNDAVGLLNSFTAPITAGSYQCNWWGSAAGPTTPPANVGGYFPWASAPIAGTSVACDTSVPTTVRVCSTAGAGFTVPTVAQAIALVAGGGTVLICDGTHTVNNVTIAKAVTVRAEGPGMPTIDAGGGARSFAVQNVPSGAASISGLRFTGGTSSQVAVFSNVGNATIADNEFHPVETNPYGVQPTSNKNGVNVSGTGIGTVTVDHNAFVGGDAGLVTGALTGATLNVTRNTFQGQVAQSLLVVANAVPPAAINVEANTFEDCGLYNCITANLPTRIANNTFTLHIARPTGSALRVASFNGSTTPHSIEENTITGVGSTGGSRALNTSYPMKGWAIVVTASPANILRNRISNAYTGIGLENGGQAVGATVSAADNVIQTTYAPFSGNSASGALSSLTSNWNDLSDWIGGLAFPAALNTATLNIRCNWWGNATGPTGMGTISSTTWTPFAAASVAGGAHTGCTP